MSKSQRKPSLPQQNAKGSISPAPLNSTVHPPCDTSNRILQKAKGTLSADTANNHHKPPTFS